MEAAIHYAHLGLRVIPLHGKVPYFDSWGDVATADDGLIRKWWSQDPNANVGIATGKRSNIFVVDVDPRHGGEESIDTLFSKHGRFPPTWEQITGGGGHHYIFRYPAITIGNKTALLPGIDIRGDGGQIVAPPSIHPETHHRYLWDGMKEPWDDPNGLKEAPLWLLDMLAPHIKAPQERELPPRIAKGVQHTTLVSMAGALRRMGLTESEIFPSLWAVNVARCEMPGPEANIHQIAHSMMRYQPHDRSLQALATKLWRQTQLNDEREQSQKKRAEAVQKASADRMRPVDAYTLFSEESDGPKEIIAGILHNGVTVFAGRPKAGKSWLVLQLAISVAHGASFLQWAKVDRPGRVSYFALEESKTRTTSRLKRLSPTRDIFLQNIDFYYSIRPLAAGGKEDLEQVLSTRCPSVVIIDTLLALCQGNTGSRRDVLRDDYREISILSELAKKHDTAFLIVHHLRKEFSGDVFDAVAGTTGITAAADCMWALQRQPDHKSLLSVRGREVEDNAWLMHLDLDSGYGWEIDAQGEAATLSTERILVLNTLRELNGATPMTLSKEMRQSPAAMRMMLSRMFKAGLVSKQGELYVAR